MTTQGSVALRLVVMLSLISCEVGAGHGAQKTPWRAPDAILVSRLGSLERPLTYNTYSDVSRNGRFVVFGSLVENLEDHSFSQRILIRDVRRKRTTLIDASPALEATKQRPPFDWGGPEISAGGRYVTFDSASTDLVRGDRNRSFDVFVYDRVSDRMRLVSRSTGGAQGDRGSFEPTISADGRYVAFTSYASNLSSHGDGRTAHVYVRDLRTGTTKIVSTGMQGSTSAPTAREGDSGSPSISADGSRIAFLSNAADVVPGDNNRAVDAFVYEQKTDSTVRVSVTSDGDQLEPFVYAEEASVYRDGVNEVEISGNGRVVAFTSHANGLVKEDKNNVPDVFVHDIGSAVTERVSVPTGGGDAYRPEDRGCGANGQCFRVIQSHSPTISYDGRFVGFLSGAPKLYPADEDVRHGTADNVFVHDRVTTTTLLVNRFPDGSPARDANLSPGAISPDGRWITYSSDSGKTVARDDKFGEDVFLQRLPRLPW